ncbi:MAG TPA: protein translocase SEC61 complex subunit gamma [Nitrosopumilaceae archaeon]
MNPRNTVRNIVNTLKLTKKSDKDDYTQHLRLVLLGMASVGAIGFVIQFVFSVATFGR